MADCVQMSVEEQQIGICDCCISVNSVFMCGRHSVFVQLLGLCCVWSPRLDMLCGEWWPSATAAVTSVCASCCQFFVSFFFPLMGQIMCVVSKLHS